MSSYSSNFSVPTLSLTTSRAKKSHGSVIPTRDYSYALTSTAPNNQNDPILDNKPQPNISNNPYTQPEKYRRPPIFPPRGPAARQVDPPSSNTSEYSLRDLNKNVYLESRDEYSAV